MTPQEASEAIATGLRAFCERELGEPPSPATRLTGGANMEIWAFDCAGKQLILRRYPNGAPSFAEEGALSLEDEAAMIGLAHDAGVRTPEVIGLLSPDDGLGSGFIMTRKPGEALPQRLFKNEELASVLPALPEQFARELARIHAIAPDAAPTGLPRANVTERINELRSSLEEYGAENPVFSYALRRLSETAPKDSPSRVLHGDFRMGNILIDAAGVSAVLDWELARLGDPVEDLAYLCIPSWRFGRYTQPVGGVGDIEDLLDAYATASGEQVDRERFQFWLIFSTLRWGVICLTMTHLWRRGADRSVERALIGTRVSEVELDLLLVLEDEAINDSTPPLPPATDDIAQPVGETTAGELAQSLREWLKTDILPKSTGKELFNARVAANALSIIQRMTTLGQDADARTSERLASLGESARSLCAGLADGRLDLSTPGVLDHLRRTTLDRLAVHQPKYAAVSIALSKWGANRQAEGNG